MRIYRLCFHDSGLKGGVTELWLFPPKPRRIWGPHQTSLVLDSLLSRTPLTYLRAFVQWDCRQNILGRRRFWFINIDELIGIVGNVPFRSRYFVYYCKQSIHKMSGDSCGKWLVWRLFLNNRYITSYLIAHRHFVYVLRTAPRTPYTHIINMALRHILTFH